MRDRSVPVPTARIFATFKRRSRIETVFFVFICLLSFFLYRNNGMNSGQLFVISSNNSSKNVGDFQFLALQLDLNEADEMELTLLPRIGEVLAKRIVDYRNENGNFDSVDDLLNVKGVGPKTLARLHPFCRTSHIEEQPSEASSGRF